MTTPLQDAQDRLDSLLASLRQYQREEHAQAQQERDERRRAWHDGRASAYGDIMERLKSMGAHDASQANPPSN